jgi:hypothetical protein
VIDTSGASHSPWLTIAVTSALVFDLVSEGCSSPQTAQINIGTREESLMKWVYISLALSAGFVGVGVMTSPKGRRWEPVVGGGLAMLIVWAQYSHARTAGLADLEAGLAGTEQTYA